MNSSDANKFNNLWVKLRKSSLGPIFLILVGMIIIMTILKPGNFLTGGNILNIIQQMTIVGALAFGACLTIITSGIDVSAGSVTALTACVVGSLVTQNRDVPMDLFPAIIITLLVGGVCGLFNGVIIAYGNVPAFIATLAMQLCARGIAQIYTGGMPYTFFTDEFLFISSGDLLGIPMFIVILIFLFVISYILLHMTKLGSRIYAIGSNRNAAVVSGINVKRTLILVYIFAGLMAGVAGILLAARTTSAMPNYAQGYEMDAITCSVIGGVSFTGGIGSIPGVLIGILIVGVLQNAMTQMLINANWQTVIKGVVILIAVLIDQYRTRNSR